MITLPNTCCYSDRKRQSVPLVTDIIHAGYILSVYTPALGVATHSNAALFWTIRPVSIHLFYSSQFSPGDTFNCFKLYFQIIHYLSNVLHYLSVSANVWAEWLSRRIHSIMFTAHSLAPHLEMAVILQIYWFTLFLIFFIHDYFQEDQNTSSQKKKKNTA